MRSLIVAAAALTAGAFNPALAQDAYVVGITAALTGPPASTYAPAVDALRIYFDRVNAAGGINGKKVNLIIQDDSAEPSKAAANAKKLLTPGQCHVAARREPVLDLCAGRGRGQGRRRAAGVRQLGLPEGCLSAGERRPVLHHGVRLDL